MLSDFFKSINWQPQSGVSSLLDYTTVVFYFLSFVFAFSIALTYSKRTHFRFWIIISIFLFLLGINKQIDMLSLITEVGRVIAKNNGWYAERHSVQSIFVFLILFTGLFIGIFTFLHLRNDWRYFLIPLTGTLFLITFVIVRAISFHHVDQLLKKHPAGLHINLMLELSGIGIILLAEVSELKMILSKQRGTYLNQPKG